ncbi:MAG: amidohydrolase family protein [Bryobacteraceae bacterium]|nr:amidohydrolase family protein [Bryobacteraceae bacterium]
MRVIDAQFHCWEAESDQWPWDPEFGKPGTPMAPSRAHYEHEPFPATGLIGAMEEVGVDAGLIVLPSIYGMDNRYALSVAAKYPDRFAVIGKTDEFSPDLETKVSSWRDQPGMLGIRVIVGAKERHRLESPELNRLFATASKYSVPICLYTPGCLANAVAVADRHTELTLVIDHLGMEAPPAIPIQGDAFAELPSLLELARRPNVSVKISGAPALSSEKYPFSDIWPSLALVFEAYGFDRAMWGSDFTRVASLHSYREALDYIRLSSALSNSEKEQLLGGTLSKIFRWPPSA